MEIMLAKKLSELDFDELVQVMFKLQLEDIDAFRSLKLLLEDL